MKHHLTIDTLGDLHQGIARAIVNKEIGLAVADLDDRGDDKKVRQVTITLSMKMREDGLVETDVRAKASLPPRQSASTVAKIKKQADGAQLLFQEMSPDNPDQANFNELDEKAKK